MQLKFETITSLSSHTREGGGGGRCTLQIRDSHTRERGGGQVCIAEKRWPHEGEGRRVNVYCRAGGNALNCYPDNLKSKQMNIRLFLSIHAD